MIIFAWEGEDGGVGGVAVGEQGGEGHGQGGRGHGQDGGEGGAHHGASLLPRAPQ